MYNQSHQNKQRQLRHIHILLGLLFIDVWYYVTAWSKVFSMQSKIILLFKKFPQWNFGVPASRQSEKELSSLNTHSTNKEAHPFKFILKPLNSYSPFSLYFSICVEHLVGWPTLWKQCHHTFDALVCPLLVVVLTALNCVKQSFSFFWHTLNKSYAKCFKVNYLISTIHVVDKYEGA